MIVAPSHVVVCVLAFVALTRTRPLIDAREVLAPLIARVRRALARRV